MNACGCVDKEKVSHVDIVLFSFNEEQAREAIQCTFDCVLRSFSFQKMALFCRIRAEWAERNCYSIQAYKSFRSVAPSTFLFLFSTHTLAELSASRRPKSTTVQIKKDSIFKVPVFKQARFLEHITGMSELTFALQLNFFIVHERAPGALSGRRRSLYCPNEILCEIATLLKPAGVDAISNSEIYEVEQKEPKWKFRRMLINTMPGNVIIGLNQQGLRARFWLRTSPTTHLSSSKSEIHLL